MKVDSMQMDALLAQVDAQELAQLCSRLVRFKTPNPPGDEAEAAAWLGDLLREHGFEVEIFEHAPRRASVVARLKGAGSRPALLLSGHLDAASLTGEAWQRDPFGGEIAEGKVWGRGATDMKGGVAAIVHAAQILARNHYPLAGDLILAFTAGEERGFIGAFDLVKRCDFGPVQALFLAEPSANDVVIAQKGMLWLQITTIGRSIHMVEMDRGRNALLMMLPILERLQRLAFPYEPHPLLGRFRYSINTIHAGKDVNTIPDECVAQVDFRTVPGQEHAHILAQVQQMIAEIAQQTELADFSANVQVLLDAPPLATAPEHPVIQTFYDIVERVTGRRPQPQGTNAGTDAVAFVPALQVPFCMCGPGTTTLVHTTDENVEIDKMVDSAKIYLSAAVDLLS